MYLLIDVRVVKPNGAMQQALETVVRFTQMLFTSMKNNRI